MLKFVIVLILLLLVGSLFAPYLSQVFGAFGGAFSTLTNNSADLITFLVSLMTSILNKPYIMTLIGALLVFAIIGMIIDFFKGGK